MTPPEVKLHTTGNGLFIHKLDLNFSSFHLFNLLQSPGLPVKMQRDDQSITTIITWSVFSAKKTVSIYFALNLWQYAFEINCFRGVQVMSGNSTCKHPSTPRVQFHFGGGVTFWEVSPLRSIIGF